VKRATGNVISELLASRLGCKGVEPIPGVAPLRGLTPGSLEKSLEKSPKIAGIIRQIHVYLF